MSFAFRALGNTVIEAGSPNHPIRAVEEVVKQT